MNEALKTIDARPTPKNLDCEPPYPIDGMVLFSIRSPDEYDRRRTAPPDSIEERAKALEDAKAFKRVAIELRIRFPVEIQYNSEFEAIVKRLEGGSL